MNEYCENVMHTCTCIGMYDDVPAYPCLAV